MNYKFPTINHISEVKNVIDNHNDFFMKEDDINGLYIFDYRINSPSTFPTVIDNDTAILRECRGLIFGADGNILSRRHHKFFNVDEKNETLTSNISIEKNCRILEKLDGSMISPVYIRHLDRFHWCTKMGITDVSIPVTDFANSRKNYIEFASYCYENNITPIFEWVSPLQVIVIHYSSSNLILTDMRQNISGEYLDYEEIINLCKRFAIPLVDTFLVENNSIVDLINNIKHIKDKEGIIIRYNNGHKIKLKSDWYIAIHKSIDRLRSEKDIISLFLNNEIDDILGKINKNFRNNIKKYIDDLWSNIHLYSSYINEIRNNYISVTDSRKEYAILVIKNNHSYCDNRLLLNNYNNEIAIDTIIAFISRHLSSSTRVENIRQIIKVKWEEYA